MRTLSIRARFPMGVYIGHRADKTPDPFPDPARLHAALLHAAATGSTAVESDGVLSPHNGSLDALRWLENNPPDAIHLPERQPQCTDRGRFAYRNEGTPLNKKHPPKKRPVSDGVSLNGPVGFRWDSVPKDIAGTLSDLCADIAVLGETESLVIIDHKDTEPNLLLDTSSSMFAPGGVKVRIPTTGRTDALLRAFAAVNPGKFKAQHAAASEQPRPSAVSTLGLRDSRYVPPEPPAPNSPWSQVLLMELGGSPIPERQRLKWCHAFHKAIIAAIASTSGDVPSIITGSYPTETQTRPANQIAIHYFTSAQASHHGIRGHAIALLIPRDASDQDLTQLAAGLSKIRWLRTSWGDRTLRFNGVSVNGDAFWDPPQDGYTRLWSPNPLAVTETRSPKASKAGRRWGLADAGVVSVAHVWRDELRDEVPTHASSDERLILLHKAARKRGVRVGLARLRPVDTSNFVHKAPKGTVPQCWSGLVDLGSLAHPTALIAIGQSRHMGGGLLEPVDIPTNLYSTFMGVTDER